MDKSNNILLQNLDVKEVEMVGTNVTIKTNVAGKPNKIYILRYNCSTDNIYCFDENNKLDFSTYILTLSPNVMTKVKELCNTYAKTDGGGSSSQYA